MSELTIDINGTCNLSCDFCYKELDNSELSTEKIKSIIDENQSSSVDIGGGEPTLHKDLPEILKHITIQGKKANVSTNATIIPGILFYLKENIKDSTTMQISLHASNKYLYEEITGKDLFDAVIENTNELKKYYSTQINTVVYKKNIDDVPNIVNLAKDLNLPVRISLVMPVGKGKNVDLINKAQLQELKTYLFSKKINGAKIESPLLHFNNCRILENAYGIKKTNSCPFDLKNKTYINSNGERSVCEFNIGEK